MSSPTSSLLQHLLTRSDLERLAIPTSQVEEWLAAKALEPIAQLPMTAPAAEGELVFSVQDADLRTDLGGRLAAVGKPTVLLSPERIRSFLQRTASGDSPANAAAADPAAAVADEVADGDLAEMLAAAIAAIDGDIEVVLQLADEGEPAVVAEVDAMVTEESLLLDDPIEPGGNSESDWFDAGELAAAMGELAPAAATEVPPDATGLPTRPADVAVATTVPVTRAAPTTPAPAAVAPIPPEAEVTSLAPPVGSGGAASAAGAAMADLAAGLDAQAIELGALATMVATHGVQLHRFEGLHEAIESLQQQVAELRAAAVAATTAAVEAPTARAESPAPSGPTPQPRSVPTPALPVTATDGVPTAVDGRRTSLMASGLALLCWSGLIWFGTGSATLALVAFVAANVIGCLALQPTRERPGR